MSDVSLPSDRIAVCAQLLRQQDRTLQLLQQARMEIDTVVTRSLLLRIRGEASDSVENGVTEAVEILGDAIQRVQFCQSELRREISSAQGLGQAAVRDELPAALTRFLTERATAPGFLYETTHDPIRGWIVHWKQFTAEGMVRGAGNLCERPHAWLEE
jgi:hypothetical protein